MAYTSIIRNDRCVDCGKLLTSGIQRMMKLCAIDLSTTFKECSRDVRLDKNNDYTLAFDYGENFASKIFYHNDKTMRDATVERIK